ncbi:MAG: Gfo/Idh/MocA family oxidoreductase [Pirellulales bacterium]
MNKVKVVVIGAGHLGRIHAQLLAQNPLAELVGIVDTTPTAREAVSRSLGVQAYAHWRQVPVTVDAAIVATPTQTHAPICLDLVGQGIHTLVEKPLADTLTAADALLGMARRHDVVLQVGHVERFNPAFNWAAEQLPQPHYISARRTGSYTFRSTDIGVVLDLMIHDLELVLHLAGSLPVDIHAWGTSFISQHEDICQARLEFSSGMVADLFACRVDSQGERQMRLFGADWQARIDFGARSVEMLRTRHHATPLASSLAALAAQPVGTRQAALDSLLDKQAMVYAEANPLELQQTNFLRSVLREENPRVGGEQGRHALAVCRQILEQLVADPRSTATIPLPASSPRKAG